MALILKEDPGFQAGGEALAPPVPPADDGAEGTRHFRRLYTEPDYRRSVVDVGPLLEVARAFNDPDFIPRAINRAYLGHLLDIPAGDMDDFIYKIARETYAEQFFGERNLSEAQFFDKTTERFQKIGEDSRDSFSSGLDPESETPAGLPDRAAANREWDAYSMTSENNKRHILRSLTARVRHEAAESRTKPLEKLYLDIQTLGGLFGESGLAERYDEETKARLANRILLAAYYGWPPSDMAIAAPTSPDRWEFEKFREIGATDYKIYQHIQKGLKGGKIFDPAIAKLPGPSPLYLDEGPMFNLRTGKVDGEIELEEKEATFSSFIGRMFRSFMGGLLPAPQTTQRDPENLLESLRRLEDVRYSGNLDPLSSPEAFGATFGMLSSELFPAMVVNRMSAPRSPVGKGKIEDIQAIGRFDEKGKKTYGSFSSESHSTTSENLENQSRSFGEAAEAVEYFRSKSTGGEASERSIGRDLADAAERAGQIVLESALAELPLLSEATSEHSVFLRVEDSRVVKVTKSYYYGEVPSPGDGVLSTKAATPIEYLRRMQLQIEVFHSDIRFEGVVVPSDLYLNNPKDAPKIITSQPMYSIVGPVLKGDIEKYLESAGFQKVPNSFFGWVRLSDGVVLQDATPDNFIKTQEGLVPIDLQITVFSDRELRESGVKK